MRIWFLNIIFWTKIISTIGFVLLGVVEIHLLKNRVLIFLNIPVSGLVFLYYRALTIIYIPFFSNSVTLYM